MSHSSAVVPTDHPASREPDTPLAARIILGFIAGYQVILSPLVGGCCRHEPSCSTYATQAVQVHGAGRGLLLAIRRLSRCRPFGTWGYDPVPPSPLRSSVFTVDVATADKSSGSTQGVFALRPSSPVRLRRTSRATAAKGAKAGQ